MLPGDRVRYYNKDRRYQGVATIVSIDSESDEATIRVTLPFCIRTHRIKLTLLEEF